MNCVLCDHLSFVFYQNPKNQYDYYHCPQCDLRFLDPQHRLNSTDEHLRYQQHNNVVTDIDYQNFVRPLLDTLVEKFPQRAHGLDYGCGPGPVLTHLLKVNGYTNIECYDPYFHPNPGHAESTYDFIYAVEVAEHFYYPGQEFQKLRNMLEPNGAVGIMTSLYTEGLDFAAWYYKNDPTHVCFYSQKTFQWISERFGFLPPQVKGNRTVLLCI